MGTSAVVVILVTAYPELHTPPLTRCVELDMTDNDWLTPSLVFRAIEAAFGDGWYAAVVYLADAPDDGFYSYKGHLMSLSIAREEGILDRVTGEAFSVGMQG